MFSGRNDDQINVQGVKKDYDQLHQQIQRILNKTGRDFDNVMYNDGDLDEVFMRTQYYNIAYKLNEIERLLSYLSRPIIEQGILRQNSSKRYELPSGRYFTSGSVCEILEEKNEECYWVYTSIEHNGSDYYATALGRDVSINGMTARIRGSLLDQ